MITIQRILCPVDLSTNSSEALLYAVALARTYDAKLFLCHCVESSSRSEAPLSDAAREKINKVFTNAIVEHLGHDDLAKIKWEGLIIEESDNPAEGITREAAERRVDLIAIRSRRRPHAAAILGSTAEAVCRIAPCPVLVTHPREREWVGRTTGELDLRRVLVAYDFSDGSERALSSALSLTQEYRAELHLLHVLLKPTQGGPEIGWTPLQAENAYHQAARRLQRAVTGAVQPWCKVTQVRWGKPYQEILAYAKEQEIDLVCMGAEGQNFGMGALFGSNVDRVLRQAPCPILVAHPLRPNSSMPSSLSQR